MGALGVVVESDTLTGERPIYKMPGEDTRFKPGYQPPANPSSIRSDPRILAHFREHTLRMIQELAGIAYDTKNAPGVRLAAISEYLTRAMGKPIQAVDLNVNDNRPIVIDGALSKLAEIAVPQTTEEKQDGS